VGRLTLSPARGGKEQTVKRYSNRITEHIEQILVSRGGAPQEIRDYLLENEDALMEVQIRPLIESIEYLISSDRIYKRIYGEAD